MSLSGRISRQATSVEAVEAEKATEAKRPTIKAPADSLGLRVLGLELRLRV